MAAVLDAELSDEGALNDALSAFTSAASRLERTHWQLHAEVARLRIELEQQNRALASSLEENERMRLLQRQILNALPCGVIVIASEAKELVLVNPVAKELLVLPEKCGWSDLPASLRGLIESEPSQGWRVGDEQQVKLAGSLEGRWLSVRCTTAQVTASVCAQPTGSGTLILTIRDTTSQKQAEDEREASRNLVALSEMATLLAHEIRNPLASMELFASLLAGDSGLVPESKKYAQCLQGGVRSLSATVNNVLRLHRPGLLPLRRIKLRDVLIHAIEFVRPLAAQNALVLSLEESIGEAEILSDPESIQQLLLNLASNSLRHTPSKGELSLRAEMQSNEMGSVALIEWADTGAGIAEENLPRVFDVGFSSDGQRTGFGLAVCKHIMEQHRGTISVISRVGEGAIFRMEFPVL